MKSEIMATRAQIKQLEEAAKAAQNRNPVCARQEDVENFYKNNERLNFMFMDQYTDFKDVNQVFKKFVNTANYVLVD
ncbi:MAG: hypothetical protein FJX80_16570 [Bacteroidetes bacterium]|nr:hypothetical protein [Bacteroidota bacterium]